MTYYTPLMMIVWIVLAILSILVRENARLSKEKKGILYFTYLVVAAAALAEWLGIQLNGNPDVSPWLLKAVKMMDYVLTPLSGWALILQFDMKNIWRRLMFLVIAANTLFQIVSVFTGWMLVIDQSNRYSHGPGYVFYIAVYLLILLLVILEFALFGHDYRRRNRFSLFAILILIVTGTAFQELLGGEVRTAYIALAVSLALLFIHNSEFAQLESDDRLHEQMVRISVDPLTGIASRYAYTSSVQQLDSMDSLPEDLVVYSIDINGLKTVNDTHGHLAGDELIRGASDCISSVFSKYGRCYRTGGDEFIVLANMDDRTIVDSLTQELGKHADAWHGKEAPSLSLAAGSARAEDHPGISIEKLISLADQEMYKVKAEYYRTNGSERSGEQQ